MCCDQNTLQFKSTSSEDHLQCWEVCTPSALTPALETVKSNQIVLLIVNMMSKAEYSAWVAGPQ